MAKRKKILIVLILLGLTVVLFAALEINQDVIINGILRINKSADPQEIQFGTSGTAKIAYDPTNGFTFSKTVHAPEVWLGGETKKIKRDSNNMIFESNGDIIIQLGN